MSVAPMVSGSSPPVSALVSVSDKAAEPATLTRRQRRNHQRHLSRKRKAEERGGAVGPAEAGVGLAGAGLTEQGAEQEQQQKHVSSMGDGYVGWAGLWGCSALYASLSESPPWHGLSGLADVTG